MIKSDENKIEIYSKADKAQIKNTINILAFLTIISAIILLFSFNVFGIATLCVLSIILITSIILFKKMPDEPKLQVVLTKEYIEIYQRKGNFKCDMNKIISFSYDQSSNSLNEVFINYYNEQNKKVTKIFFLIGMNNRKFVEIANGVLNNKDSINKCEMLNHNDDKEIVNEENANEEMQWGNVAKILYYAGKKRLVTKINNRKNVDRLDNLLCFVDKNGKEYKIFWDYITLEKDLELNVNKFYAVKYDPKAQEYNITYTDFKFDINIVEQYKNKLDIKATLICDDEIISKEISLLDKYRIAKQICKYALVLTLLLLSILITIKKEWYIFIMFELVPILLFSILLIFAIITMYFIEKIKKIEN